MVRGLWGKGCGQGTVGERVWRGDYGEGIVGKRVWGRG